MPRKVRELVRELLLAGFQLERGAGKGSHRKFTHLDFAGIVTISGHEGDDAKPYQEKQVARAIGSVNENR